MQNRWRLPEAVSFRLLELPILRNAAAIHFTPEAERRKAVELDHQLAEQTSVVIPLPVAGPALVNSYQLTGRAVKSFVKDSRSCEGNESFCFFRE
jgi:hypothetical protein